VVNWVLGFVVEEIGSTVTDVKRYAGIFERADHEIGN
jgi:hypothetical protein